MKEIYEMKGAGRSVRAIAGELGIARNTVRRYLKSPEAIRAKPRPQRASKLDPYTGYVDRRLDEGLENCVVLHRELRARGYDGGYSILKAYVSPKRRRRQPDATMRFETAPGEQAQVDWGSLAYIGQDGKRRRVWVFVMTLGWSRACYVELVRKADTAAFIQCHVNAFEYLGGVPRRCLYDNAKVITLGRDEEKRPVWNRRMLDFALRVGFEARLCQPYRAQTKGKVESGVKYVRRNMWPSLRFTDDADLNRQALEWCDVVANARVHGTTYRIPWEMLDEERPIWGRLPGPGATLAPYLREDRKVARDGFVSWEGIALRGPLEMGGSRSCRWDSVRARWRSGLAMSASRSIPGPSRQGSASSCPASGQDCPGGMAGHAGKRWRWRRRSPPARWSAALWTYTNWPPWGAPDDRAGTGSQAPGDPGTETSRRGSGQLPGHRRQQAADLPPEMLADLLGVEVTARRERTSPPGPSWPTCPSSALWTNSTLPSSPQSTSGR